MTDTSDNSTTDAVTVTAPAAAPGQIRVAGSSPVPVDATTGDSDDAADEAGDGFDRDRAMHTIRALRAEVKQYRSQAKDAAALAARLKEIEDAEKTELQLARDRAGDLEQQIQAAVDQARAASLRAAVHELAPDIGLASPTLAVRAVDRSLIEWDDSHTPTNLRELLEQLAEEEPALRRQAARTPSTNATGGAGGQPPPSLTAEQLAWAERTGMTPDEYRSAMNLRTLSDYQAERGRQTTA